MAVDQDATADRIVQAGDEIGQSCLTRPTGTHQGHQLTRLSPEGNMFQHLIPRLGMNGNIPFFFVLRTAGFLSLVAGQDSPDILHLAVANYIL